MFDLPFTPEDVKAKFSEITDFTKENDYPTTAADTFNKVNQNLDRIREKKDKEEELKKSQAASTPTSNLKSDMIFGMMRTYLDRGLGKSLIQKCGAVYGFDVLAKKGAPVARSYTIDLKNGQGTVYGTAPKSPDATFTMTDEDFH